MLQPAIHRHFPKSPLERRRDSALRAEVTRLATDVLRLEKSQEIQFKRIAQIQHELDQITRMLKKLTSGE